MPHVSPPDVQALVRTARRLRVTAVGLAFLFSCAASLAAQQTPRATLTGRIVDEASATVVAGAQVLLVNTAFRSVSDDLGAFEFTDLPPGAYIVEVRQPGYAAHQDTIAVVAGETLEVRFALGVDAIPLEPITVVARSNVEDAAFLEGRRFDGMTRPEIEEVLGRVRSMGDLLREAHAPGVSVVEVSGAVCAEHNRVTRNRRNSFGQDVCRPMALYLDGVRQPNPTVALLSIDPEAVERFDILSPTQGSVLYGAEAASGVIVVETQRGGRQLSAPLVLYPHDEARIRLSFGMVGANPAFSHDGLVISVLPGRKRVLALPRAFELGDRA